MKPQRAGLEYPLTCRKGERDKASGRQQRNVRQAMIDKPPRVAKSKRLWKIGSCDGCARKNGAPSRSEIVGSRSWEFAGACTFTSSRKRTAGKWIGWES